jgi:hypothetical protein
MARKTRSKLSDQSYTVRRMDTEEVVRVRALTEAELATLRQPSLPGTPGEGAH